VTDLEQEYSPSSRVGGDSGPFVADYMARSAAARHALGDRERRLEGGSLLVDAGAGAPVLVFVHGGYWQALSAEASLYLAPSAAALGWSYAAVEYTLAPAADLLTMVQECASAVAAIAAAVGDVPVVVAGHSAGAHLTAMITLVHRPPVPVARSVLVSGVYDLRPLVHTTVNDPLGLDLPRAEAASPMLLPVTNRPETTVVWGDNETDAFKAQGTTYAARLRGAGVDVSAFECAGRHHFDIVDDLVDPATELGAFTLGGLR
jgi:arylformamidase